MGITNVNHITSYRIIIYGGRRSSTNQPTFLLLQTKKVKYFEE